MNSKDSLQKEVRDKLSKFYIKPNFDLGQHFLMDSEIVKILANEVRPNHVVIEIGSGLGQLTEELAKRADSIISIEIDNRFKPILSQIVQRYPNVEIKYADALKVDLHEYESQNLQIVSSLPYQISEAFMHKLAGLDFDCAILLVGKRLSYAIQAENEEDPSFGQMTILSQTFFDSEVIRIVSKKCFYPQPKTDSAIISLTPKVFDKTNKRDFLLRYLFKDLPKSPLIKNAIKEGLIEFHKINELENLSQNDAREVILVMKLSENLLNKSFQQLNNLEIGSLSKSL